MNIKHPTEGVLAEAHAGLRVIIPKKPSRPVRLTDLARVWKDSSRIKLAMMNPFPGRYPVAFSIAHPQIEESDPLRFFVVGNARFADGKKLKWYFGGMRTIINPQIIWKSETTTRYKEACMSFPFEAPKKINRHNVVVIKYWTFLGPRTKKFYEERAQMFQHEIDHFHGVTLYERWKKKKR